MDLPERARPKTLIFSPAPCKLTGATPPGLREPPRPTHQRQENYSEVFDFHTLWFDAFQAPSGDEVRLIAPPFLNLESWFRTSRFRNSDGDTLPVQIRQDSNLTTIRVPKNETGFALQFEAEGLSCSFHPAPNQSEMFTGRRVLLTMVKDDHLVWIKDWLSFHVHHHGADAVLIYNNNSDAYSNQELLDTLKEVPGIQSAVVVHWPFPYGPDGGGDMPWDSNYCQAGGLSHAHHRFLREAAGVLICDVDELVLDAEGCSIFDLCDQSPSGYLQFPGRWVYCIDQPGQDWPSPLRHRHHLHNVPEWGAGCPMKWAVNPRRIDPSYQWTAHGLHDGEDLSYLLDGLEYRHIRGISTSWKHDRTDRWRYDPAVHQFDQSLAKAFDSMS